MPELHRSARKHYRRDQLDDSAVLYAAAHVLHSHPLDDEDDPGRWLMIGTDPAGRLLELVTLIYDDGYVQLGGGVGPGAMKFRQVKLLRGRTAWVSRVPEIPDGQIPWTG